MRDELAYFSITFTAKIKLLETVSYAILYILMIGFLYTKTEISEVLAVIYGPRKHTKNNNFKTVKNMFFFSFKEFYL